MITITRRVANFYFWVGHSDFGWVCSMNCSGSKSRSIHRKGKNIRHFLISPRNEMSVCSGINSERASINMNLKSTNIKSLCDWILSFHSGIIVMN